MSDAYDVDPSTGELTPIASAELSIMDAKERAAIDVQVATAHRFPRKMQAVRDRIVSLATMDEETAISCFYSVPRGGKRVEGPSVRMAEIVASSYGNMRVQSSVREVQGDTARCVARAWDLETNYAVEVEIPRRVLTGKPTGDAYKDASRRADAEALAQVSGQAIARRTVIFNLVPTAVLRTSMAQIRETALGKAETLNARRTKAIEHLAKMGVDLPHVMKALGRDEDAKPEDVTAEDLLTLRSWLVAIKEGTATVDEVFFPPEEEAAAAAKGAEEAIRTAAKPTAEKAPAKKAAKKKGAKKKKAAPKPKPEPEPEPEEEYEDDAEADDGEDDELDEGGI